MSVLASLLADHVRLAGVLAFFAAVLVALPARAGTLYAQSPLALHGGPGDDFATRATLEPGSRFEVLWCNAGDWCLVQQDAVEGWAPLTALHGNGSADVATPPDSNTSPASSSATAASSAAMASGSNATPATSPGASGNADASRGSGISVSVGGVSVGVKLH